MANGVVAANGVKMQIEILQEGQQQLEFSAVRTTICCDITPFAI